METNVYIHPSAEVAEGAKIGKGTKIWNQTQVREMSVIGCNCNIGKNNYIDNDVIIGDRVKFQNNITCPQGTRVGDDVFVGPCVTFTNDMYPRAFSENWKIMPVTVGKGASIGSNAVIRCGVSIGKYATVGCGAVVTRDVRAHALVVGNPARQIGWVCECGNKLDKNFGCEKCGKTYHMDEIDKR